MTISQTQRRRISWPAVLGGGLVIAAIGWTFSAALLAKYGSEPIGAVVQSIGRLEPFTRPLASGSVVLLGADTVGVLDSFVTTETSNGAGGHLVLVQGKWAATSGTHSLGFPHLVGRVVGRIDSAALVLVLLDTTTSTGSVSLGILALEPGGGTPIPLVAGSK